MTFRRNFIFLDSVSSTNLHTESLLLSGSLPEGSVIYTNEQTLGVGLGTNRWFSEPGKNITATVVLYPDFLPPEDQFKLTMAVSVSVCLLVESIDISMKPEIKWPNDIYLDGRKLAGMLIKNSISANSISHTIAGVGINVNQKLFGKEVPLAISLAQITGCEYDIPDLLTKWHKFLEKIYLDLKNGNSDELHKAYMDKFYLKGKAAGYIINGEKMIATINGIGDYGQLKLISADGREFTCGLKEVEFIPDSIVQN